MKTFIPYFYIGIQLLQYHLLKTVFYALNYFRTFVENQLTILVISVSELCSVPSICMSVLISVLHCLDYCSFIISLIQVMQVLYLVLFFKIVLVFLGPLPFHMNFKISLSPFCKRLVMIFIGITLNLYIVISAILSLSNPCIWHISPFF